MKRYEMIRERDDEVDIVQFEHDNILDMIQEGKNSFDAGWSVRIIEIDETVLVEFTH